MSTTEQAPKARPRRIEPPATEVTDEFWDATKDEKYLVQWCSACEDPVFYPREVCPSCLASDTLEWRQAPGNGTVYAFSVQHRPANPLMADRVPYTVAMVEVDAGNGKTIRVMTNIVDCEPGDVSVGMPVTVAWEPLTDGRNLPQFRPASS